MSISSLQINHKALIFRNPNFTKLYTTNPKINCLVHQPHSHNSSSSQRLSNRTPRNRSTDCPKEEHGLSKHTPHNRSTKCLRERDYTDLQRNLLLDKLRQKDSDPVRILEEYGDWNDQLFWVVVGFLKHTSRCKEVLEVFNVWRSKESSRVNELNYQKILWFLVEDRLVEEAEFALKDMKSQGLQPPLEMFNSLIHGFASKGCFEEAMFCLKEMEDFDLKPDPVTYDGLLKSYAKHRMYDEMEICVKKMESQACFPDQNTYNLLVKEFSKAGLLRRMERTNRIIRSKRMALHPSSMVSILNAYANFGILDKMEKVYRRILNSKAFLKEDLIRKVAGVYIENNMFSRLDDMGLDLSYKMGRTDIVWCLRILSHACLLSRKGMDSIVEEMESGKVPWNITIANIMLLAHLKMEDMNYLRVVLSELPARRVKPDIVTLGIIFDSSQFGFDGSPDLHTWSRMGFLDEVVECDTDPLVLTVFGKGHFLRSCEDVYSSLKANSNNKVLTYGHLIKLVPVNKKKDGRERNSSFKPTSTPRIERKKSQHGAGSYRF